MVRHLEKHLLVRDDLAGELDDLLHQLVELRDESRALLLGHRRHRPQWRATLLSLCVSPSLSRALRPSLPRCLPLGDSAQLTAALRVAIDVTASHPLSLSPSLPLRWLPARLEGAERTAELIS